VTLEVKDEPLGVAAILALAPFGDEARWPEPPLALRRVSFTLRDAGYLEVLDTLGEAGGYGRVLTPHHPFLEGRPNECITWGSPGPPLLALDLTASVRLLAWGASTRDASYLDLWLIAPPAMPRRTARFQSPALQVDFEPWQFGQRAPGPLQRAGSPSPPDNGRHVHAGRHAVVGGRAIAPGRVGPSRVPTASRPASRVGLRTPAPSGALDPRSRVPLRRRSADLAQPPRPACYELNRMLRNTFYLATTLRSRKEISALQLPWICRPMRPSSAAIFSSASV
jgi:hypothetical protein